MRPWILNAILVLTISFAWLADGKATQTSESLPQPAGRVILTITGNIGNTNSEKGAEFDREMLEAIGMVDITTETPFIPGETVFRGVRMSDLMRVVGANGTEVEAAALDLYTSKLPIADFEKHDVILALEANGRKLRVRDRGPSWIMYPFSSDPAALDNEVIHSRCVWQLVSLDVR
ncbi:MAG: molybdopterin-dependent oxidoreductase [Pseudomonadota bacterium]